MPNATAEIPQILEAKRPEEVFGELPGNQKAQLHRLRGEYRRLARIVHPDANPLDPDASKTFAQLTKLYDAAQKTIVGGTYGTDKAPPVDPIRVRSRRHAYVITEPRGSDAVCNYYNASYKDDEDVERPVIFKIARSRHDNDLLTKESKVLKKLLSDTENYDLMEPYLPSYIESFGYKGPHAKKPRQVNVFRRHERNFYSLEQVMEHYRRIDPRDMAWMFRRLLYGLGLAHNVEGVLHGAILPSNLYIQPEDHGLEIRNWIHSVARGEKIKTIEGAYRDWYPLEVIEKDEVLPGTDIFCAVRCMVYLIGGDPTTGYLGNEIDKRLRSFFRGCTFASVKKRPQDAWDLLDEFNELIEMLWGPRRFRPFSM